MGLFGNDEQQDQRLDAIESYLRVLTEIAQQNQLDIASLGVRAVVLESQLEEKVAAADVDPALVELNEQIGITRKQVIEAASAAADSWETLQQGVRKALDQLNAGIQQASSRS